LLGDGAFAGNNVVNGSIRLVCEFSVPLWIMGIPKRGGCKLITHSKAMLRLVVAAHATLFTKCCLADMRYLHRVPLCNNK
jgi:hypothetical protein